MGEHDTVLRAFWTSERGLHGGEIEGEQLGVLDLGSLVVMEHALLACVGLDESDLIFGASGQAQIFQSLFVDGEDSAGGAVFGRHVGDGGAIGEREIAQSRAEVFDEFAHHSMLAQHLGDGQNEVGGGGSFAQSASELHSNHKRNEHGDRLAEHRRLGFDPSDSPTEDAQAIHHGGVAVGADQGVGVGLALTWRLTHEDYAGQVFEIDLVDDAGIRRNDGEISESGLTPAEEGVALLVALEFEQRVHFERVAGAEFVDLDGVINDQFDGLQRINQGGVAA